MRFFKKLFAPAPILITGVPFPDGTKRDVLIENPPEDLVRESKAYFRRKALEQDLRYDMATRINWTDT